MFDTTALLETAKSLGRFVWFFLLGSLASALVALTTTPEILGSTVTVAGMTLPLGSLIAASVAALAKLLDRYVYANKNINTNGIAPNFLQR